jgi:P4 family phage/plasmid primase-like protien
VNATIATPISQQSNGAAAPTALSLNGKPCVASGQDVKEASVVHVSCVKNARDTATRHYDPKEIFEWIRSDKLRTPIQNIRRGFLTVMASTNNDRRVAKKAIDADKKRLPAVMWSATFRRRKRDAIMEHSGLLCADLDELGDQLPEVRAKLRKSPHLWADFVSPSGDGLKCVFRVPADADKHKASFHAIEKHVYDLTGIQIDQACSDVARLCFLSYDPDAYLNEDATELPPLSETANRQPNDSALPTAPEVKMRREIAEEVLGEIDWETETAGYCGCPAQHLHTTGDGPRDCKVFLDKVPTIKCFHNHCKALIEGVNHELRSRIGKAEFRSGNGGLITPNQWFDERFPLLSDQFGDAVCVARTMTGSLYVQDIAEDFIAATLCEESRPDAPTAFIPLEQKFYTYEPAQGIYVHRREPTLFTDLSRLLLECARDCDGGAISIRALEFRLRSAAKLSGVLKKAQGILAAPDGFFSTGLTEFIPCANGMLRLSDKTLLAFGPAYRRRNKLAVPFDPDAKCPLFLNTLMHPALDPEELDLLQRWCGLALIGENLAQRFLILSGTAGGGKGTFIRVLVGIIGQSNVAMLRTKLLHERFELSRFLGRTLLYGADVPENFLNQRGASVIKALTGGDPVTLEFKRSNERPQIICAFNALVTCNSRLTVHLEGDTDAWRRRLVIVDYHKQKPARVIANLSEQILATESSGVLNWMLDGLDKVRADGWQLHLTARQQKIVDDLLLESEGHNIFAKEALVLDAEGEITVDDCYNAYIGYCGDRGWITLPRNKFSQHIRDTIAREHGITMRHDLTSGMFASQRGWKGIRLGNQLQENKE